MTPQQAVSHVLEGGTLTQEQAASVMRGIMEGEGTAVQIAALLVLLRQRGESVAEIAGFARVMRDKAVPVAVPAGVVCDTCGTGGDGTGTFNISTLAALVVAAAGVTVAKHGNRSVSSRVGSADLLEALGVRLELDAQRLEECLRTTGFAFLFAPLHHRAMKHAAGPRRELGVRTVFNVLGPLTNPARATHQVLGVYDAGLTVPLAEVLGILGVQRALVVHGMDGVDEVSSTGPTRAAELRDGIVRERCLEPADFGLSPCRLEDLQGGDLQANVRIAQAVLDGDPGPCRDAVALNAAAALFVAGQVEDLAAGFRRANGILSSGAARGMLENVVRFTQQEGGT